MNKIEQRLRELIEHVAGQKCNFWACPGPFNKQGEIRRRYQAMLTCSNCQEVIITNNLIRRLGLEPLRFINVMPVDKDNVTIGNSDFN